VRRTPRLSRQRADREGWEADRALLAARLRLLGLPPVSDVQLHDNRRVMVSLTRRGVLRIHRGYAYAPDRTLEAVVTFLRPGVTGRVRDAARRDVVAFAAERFQPASRRHRGSRRVPAADRALVAELRRCHDELNRRHFGGALAAVPIRLSRRMSIRLGELAVDRTTGRAAEIALNRGHVERDGWAEVRDTLLHEMVHQWQVETGHAPDHGSRFRAKAREVGIVPAARKAIGAGPAD